MASGLQPTGPFMRFRLTKGLDLALAGAPVQHVTDGPAVGAVGVLAEDYRGVVAAPAVREGERVRAGQVLFRDRRHPALVCTAPGSGVVDAVHVGPRRALHSIAIRLDGADDAAPCPAPAGDTDPARLRAWLCEAGLWMAFRTRPYGAVPRPDAAPAAIFVTAIDTNPLAADPRVVIGAHADAFAGGVRALARLVPAPVFLCVAPGDAVPSADVAGVRVAEFAGPHPAGLPGTHIHHLAPASAERTVWYVGYQDVIAIGATLADGRPWLARTVALGGPGVRRPRLIRTRLGAAVSDLVRDELDDGPCRIVSGSVLSGRTVAERASYLGRHHDQITVLRDGAAPRATDAAAGPMLPLDVFDRVVPLDVLPSPLLRALLAGDVERAEALGALELEEEDLALCSVVCPGRNDYGRLLRAALERIERQT